jgi:hypothetical protein
MLERGELSRVVADLGLAKRLIASATRHLTSAEQLSDSDPELAYAALHDAVRKAMAAMLQAHGLRADDHRRPSGCSTRRESPVWVVNGQTPSAR